ncbi:MAG: PP2C family protein-serine/threonine phosphatase [Tepidisphaeraceae bacterium]
MSATTAQSEPHTMRCLEVWGGNQAVDNGVVMAGLDAWLYSRPYRDQAAGGDIHYVSSCAAGMLTRVLVADVSGHGEAVADAAHRLRGLMRRYVNIVDQTRFVEGLNTDFSELAQAGGFATAVAATYFGPTDQFTVCNAGHPRPLWYRSRTRTWTLMSAAPDKSALDSTDSPANIPLGIAGPTRYDQFAVKLATGDLVVLYTDSLIEAKGADGQMLGEDGLLAKVRQLEVDDAGELARALLNAIERHGEASADDVTVLILRPNGLKPRMSLPVMLRAMKRMTFAFFASLRPGGPEFPAPESGLFALLGRLSQRIRRRRAGRVN